MERTALLEKIKSLPHSPGVYIMKDPAGKIIYVGKALDLKKRVGSYFARDFEAYKTGLLVDTVDDMDFMATDTEKEALLLEYTLIKKHRPRFNISFKDDKKYPYIRITVKEDFPGVYPTRNLAKDGAKYYGPYTSVGSMRETIAFIRKLVMFRSCRKEIPSSGDGKAAKTGRMCLNYHIKRCPGVCAGNTDKKSYARSIKELMDILEGKTEGVKKRLEEKMAAYAKELEYEKAAAARDLLVSIEKITSRQKMTGRSFPDRDFINFAFKNGAYCFNVIFYRSGQAQGGSSTFVEQGAGVSEGELTASFLLRFYLSGRQVPPGIALPVLPENPDDLLDILSQERGGRVSFHLPERGQGAEIIELCARNAGYQLDIYTLKKKVKEELSARALGELKEALKLPSLPRRVEIFDISNLFGTNACGSMASFKDGAPDKANYRIFKIKTVKGTDDYKMMREVVGRRYQRLLKEGRPLPDLILIDGGLGHINAVKQLLDEAGLSAISVIGIAKQEEKILKAEDGSEADFSAFKNAHNLLMFMRDEAHRFALAYHKKLRDKEMKSSELMEIKGIGKKTYARLIAGFGSMEKIKALSLKELLASRVISRSAGEALYAHFHPEK